VQEDECGVLTHDGTVGHESCAFDVEEEADAVDFDSHLAAIIAFVQRAPPDGRASTI
jgi:hypothetical protein